MSHCGLSTTGATHFGKDSDVWVALSVFTLVLFGGAPVVNRVEAEQKMGRAFEKAVRRKPLARRTRAICQLNGAKESC